jgi:hypothetical protein
MSDEYLARLGIFKNLEHIRLKNGAGKAAAKPVVAEEAL